MNAETGTRDVYTIAVFRMVPPPNAYSEYSPMGQLVRQFTALDYDRALAAAKREAEAIGGYVSFWPYGGYLSDKVAKPISKAYDLHFGKRLDAGEVLSEGAGWWEGCECGCREAWANQ